MTSVAALIEDFVLIALLVALFCHFYLVNLKLYVYASLVVYFCFTYKCICLIYCSGHYLSLRLWSHMLPLFSRGIWVSMHVFCPFHFLLKAYNPIFIPLHMLHVHIPMWFKISSIFPLLWSYMWFKVWFGHAHSPLISIDIASLMLTSFACLLSFFSHQCLPLFICTLTVPHPCPLLFLSTVIDSPFCLLLLTYFVPIVTVPFPLHIYCHWSLFVPISLVCLVLHD